jgi:hypothetical protein
VVLKLPRHAQDLVGQMGSQCHQDVSTFPVVLNLPCGLECLLKQGLAVLLGQMKGQLAQDLSTLPAVLNLPCGLERLLKHRLAILLRQVVKQRR